MEKSSANLNLLTKEVRTAGVNLLRDFAEVQLRQATMEGADRLAARAAYRTEAQIVAALREARPNYGVTSTFEGASAGADPTRRWVVQGIVGWKNFSRAFPHWGISAALEHKGKIAEAVIYDPYKDEMFRSQRGNGAYVNNMRLRVSRRKRLKELVVAEDRQNDAKGGLLDWSALEEQAGEVRRSGVAELDIVYVAAGRFDAFVSTRSNTIGFAASTMILSESGGMSRTILKGDSGKAHSDKRLHQVGLIASNLNAFDRFAQLVRNHVTEVQG